MSDGGASSEFVAEAQEIVDALNRDLISAENFARAGSDIEPELVNNLFRSAHSLKGISGMFGYDKVTRLAHAMENALDGMRMGRLSIDANALDVLFACVERFGIMIAEASLGEVGDAIALDEVIVRLDRLTRKGRNEKHDFLDLVGLGEQVVSVLTEYEEHRLRENIRRGRDLFLLRSSFDLSDFDLGLAELDAAVKNLGEVITKLPSSKESEPGKISFDIIVGSNHTIEDLRLAISDERVDVSAVAGETPPKAAKAAPKPHAKTVPETEGVVKEESREKDTEAFTTLKSVSQTVRVDIKRLDRLMNLVGELALTKAAFQRISEMMKRDHGFTGHSVELHKESRNFERRLAELQAGIMEVRMVPVGNLFERMVRVGRKIGRELGREVRIDVSGEHTELDKLIVEDLADPLMHLIRNAIDHGIESPEERTSAGKPAEGVVRLSAAAQGNHVIVEVSDDGRGVDIKRTLNKALEKNLVQPDRAHELSRREVFNLLFLPGFSTKQEVSEYSGRGVGMDVVKTNISQLSGVVDIDSGEGAGTKVTITLPITLAIIPALIVAVSGRTYAIPLNNVLETMALEPEIIDTIERREVISLRGSTVPLIDLRDMFRLEGSDRPGGAFGVIAGVGQKRMALVVDELVGQQDIVIKSLGRRLRHVPGIAGATELGNQQTILVIDMVELLNELVVQAS